MTDAEQGKPQGPLPEPGPPDGNGDSKRREPGDRGGSPDKQRSPTRDRKPGEERKS